MSDQPRRERKNKKKPRDNEPIEVSAVDTVSVEAVAVEVIAVEAIADTPSAPADAPTAAPPPRRQRRSRKIEPPPPADAAIDPPVVGDDPLPPTVPIDLAMVVRDEAQLVLTEATAALEAVRAVAERLSTEASSGVVQALQTLRDETVSLLADANALMALAQAAAPAPTSVPPEVIVERLAASGASQRSLGTAPPSAADGGSAPTAADAPSASSAGRDLPVDPETIIEIRDPELDLDAIMAEIRAGLATRGYTAADYAPEAPMFTAEALADPDWVHKLGLDPEMAYLLHETAEHHDGLAVTMDVQPSNAPIGATLINRVKHAAHELVVYYVNHVAQRQVTVNSFFFRAVARLAGDVAALKRENAELRAELRAIRARLGDDAR